MHAVLFFCLGRHARLVALRLLKVIGRVFQAGGSDSGPGPEKLSEAGHGGAGERRVRGAAAGEEAAHVATRGSRTRSRRGRQSAPPPPTTHTCAAEVGRLHCEQSDRAKGLQAVPARTSCSQQLQQRPLCQLLGSERRAAANQQGCRDSQETQGGVACWPRLRVHAELSPHCQTAISFLSRPSRPSIRGLWVHSLL